MEKQVAIVIAVTYFGDKLVGMGETLELVVNLIGGLLEFFAELFLGEFAPSDTKASRIFWCIVLVFLGGIIWWEIR